MKLASFFAITFLISRRLKLENAAFLLLLEWVNLKKVSCLLLFWGAACIGHVLLSYKSHLPYFFNPRLDPKVVIFLMQVTIQSTL